MTNECWAAQFDAMVHPLHRVARVVLPQMIQRRAGKIVVIGSANGLRGRALRLLCFWPDRRAISSWVRYSLSQVVGKHRE
jgi:NAD(P)-dependent dehydrogenase (short-subunit alcohol dehydrogenase family)